VQTFITPRLQRVVQGTDNVGISVRESTDFKNEVAAGYLSPAEAKEFLRYLKRLSDPAKSSNLAALKLRSADMKVVADEISDFLATERVKADVAEGGGFTTLRMAQSIYEVDDENGSIYLSDAALNGSFGRAVCGQLGFRHESEDAIFCGRKGRTRLAVVDGIADEQLIRAVVASLGAGETTTIVAKGVEENASELLRELSRGSKIRKVPEDLFAKGIVK
jgi:hypothetical protein